MESSPEKPECQASRRLSDHLVLEMIAGIFGTEHAEGDAVMALDLPGAMTTSILIDVVLCLSPERRTCCAKSRAWKSESQTRRVRPPSQARCKWKPTAQGRCGAHPTTGEAFVVGLVRVIVCHTVYPTTASTRAPLARPTEDHLSPRAEMRIWLCD